MLPERPWRGPLLACLVVGLGILFDLRSFRNPLGHYDRHLLPGFDAYVYMAMADHPSVFTLGPWGYRILTPWVVHLLPFDTPVGFLWTGASAFGLSGLLLFFFLRRLGIRDSLALFGVLFYVLCPPVREILGYRFLSEPLCLLLEVALLLALEASPSAGLLSLLSVLGVLAKEEFLLFLPVIYFSRRSRDGDRAAALKALLPGLLSALALLVLREWWAPLTTRPEPALTAAALWLSLSRILAEWREWWSAPLVGGLTLLALIGARLPRGKEFLVRYGYLALIAAGVAFAASIYNHEELVGFFPADVRRLLVYAVPVLLPAGLLFLEAFFRPVAPAASPQRALGWAGAVLALAGALLPLATQDRYRRIDLRGYLDGRLVLALCRETVAFASRLERGKPVLFEPEARAFPSVGSDPAYLERMRWFLRDGWGQRPHYQTGEVVMQDPEASVLIPCFRPREWTLVLTLSAREPFVLSLSLNGTPLADLSLGLDATRYKVPVHAGALYRGDNRLELKATGPGRARLHELAIHPVS